MSSDLISFILSGWSVYARSWYTIPAPASSFPNACAARSATIPPVSFAALRSNACTRSWGTSNPTVISTDIAHEVVPDLHPVPDVEGVGPHECDAREGVPDRIEDEDEDDEQERDEHD